MDVTASLSSDSWMKAPHLWDLRVFLWTSADWPAWNEVLLDVDTTALVPHPVHSNGEDGHPARRGPQHPRGPAA